MNNKPVDRTKKSNIKCEHCKHWDKKWCVCALTNEDKNYWNRCRSFEWAEREDKWHRSE